MANHSYPNETEERQLENAPVRHTLVVETMQLRIPSERLIRRAWTDDATGVTFELEPKRVQWLEQDSMTFRLFESEAAKRIVIVALDVTRLRPEGRLRRSALLEVSWLSFQQSMAAGLRDEREHRMDVVRRSGGEARIFDYCLDAIRACFLTAYLVPDVSPPTLTLRATADSVEFVITDLTASGLR